MSELAMLRVLHLDDNPFELDKVKAALSQNAFGASFHVESFYTAESFLARLGNGPSPDVIILDVDLGTGFEKGAQIAKKARTEVASAAILMCSAMDDAQTISNCLTSGADDFISKKSDGGEFSLRVYQSYRLCALKRGAVSKVDPVDQARKRKSQSFAGDTVSKISARIPRILESAITAVHVCGESGTGKEVISEIIESYLPTNKPFVRVNCGAISPSLLESELFGHTKGAFTGASGDKRGLIEAANGGWIFLDEIATLSSSAQVSLLRAVENQEVLRVGDNTPRKVEVKVLSATNEKLEDLVKAGRFRKDLWQRLRETEILLPPLRERVEEIPAIVDHFLKTMAGGPYKVAKPALEVLCAAPWREGNIRELRNCLRAMTELNVDKLLTPLAIPQRIWEAIGEPEEKFTSEQAVALPKGTDKNIVLNVGSNESYNYDLLADKLLLELTKKFSSKSKTSLRSLAREIGMSRSTLSGRLKALVQRQIISMSELSSMVGVNEV